MSRLMMPYVLVAQKNIAIIERLGKFNRLLEPGFNFKIPFLEQIAYTHSLKEEVYDISD